MTQQVHDLNNALTDLLSETPKPPGMEDWEYRDLPKMRSDFFDQFVELIGEENIRWITKAHYVRNGETYERGQMWVSPAGLDRARAHTAASTQ